MILLIDNYDSFTYNLVQRLGEIDPALDLEVHRNDQITIEQIAAKNPTHMIISPGPCTPREAGISCAAVEHFAGKLPLLGVCLGHQAIGDASGGRIVRARRLMHGKVDLIHHHGRGLFVGLPNPFEATRYHSLVIEPGTLSDDYEITAWSELPEGGQEIMAVQHKRWPVYGLQFHPESFLTLVGSDILRRFLELRPTAVVAKGTAPFSSEDSGKGDSPRSRSETAATSGPASAGQHQASAQHPMRVQTLDPSFEPIEE